MKSELRRIFFLLIAIILLFNASAIDDKKFCKAVYDGNFKKVERIIKQKFLKNKNGEIQEGGYRTFYNGIAEVVHWLNSQSCIEKASTEQCTAHICIWPGWLEVGVRFKTKNGIVEKCFTLQFGRTRYLPCFIRCLNIFDTSKDVLVYKGMQNCEGFIEAQRQNCIRDSLEQIRQNIENSISFRMEVEPTSWISPYTPVYEMNNFNPLKVKISISNRGEYEQNILWTTNQNFGKKIVYFGLVDQTWKMKYSEPIMLDSVQSELITPTIVSLKPQETLTENVSINNPFCCDMNINCRHILQNVEAGEYRLVAIYKPYIENYSGADFWKPINDSVCYYFDRLNITNSNPLVESLSLKVKIVEKFDMKTGAFNGKYGSSWFDAKAIIVNNFENPQFIIGDTIALKLKFDFYKFLWYFPDPRPISEFELANKKDICIIDLESSIHPESDLKNNMKVYFINRIFRE